MKPLCLSTAWEAHWLQIATGPSIPLAKTEWSSRRIGCRLNLQVALQMSFAVSIAVAAATLRSSPGCRCSGGAPPFGRRRSVSAATVGSLAVAAPLGWGGATVGGFTALRGPRPCRPPARDPLVAAPRVMHVIYSRSVEQRG